MFFNDIIKLDYDFNFLLLNKYKNNMIEKSKENAGDTGHTGLSLRFTVWSEINVSIFLSVLCTRKFTLLWIKILCLHPKFFTIKKKKKEMWKFYKEENEKIDG